MLHQRLGAMVPGADRHARLVQYGADVMRMRAVDRKADDAGSVLRPEQAHGVDPRQPFPRPPHQRGPMLAHPVNGNASCRERGGQYALFLVDDATLTHTTTPNSRLNTLINNHT